MIIIIIIMMIMIIIIVIIIIMIDIIIFIFIINFIIIDIISKSFKLIKLLNASTPACLYTYNSDEQKNDQKGV